MQFKKLLKSRLSYKQIRWLRDIYYFLMFPFHRNNLTRLARVYGSDKGDYHKYTLLYEKHFRKLRFKRIGLLEIGVGGYDNPVLGGGSLRMWKRYFPFGRIYSIDIYDKSLLQGKRIKIFRGDQSDPEFLKETYSKIGRLDIVIDDGSHINSHVIDSFKILFPLLSSNGVYVVEDTQTSYMGNFGGDPDRLDNEGTMMNFFKKLADGPNYSEFKNDKKNYPASLGISSIHFYHNIIFIYKSH
jgi:hypothetical protein